jgi:hypothetical protein
MTSIRPRAHPFTDDDRRIRPRRRIRRRLHSARRRFVTTRRTQSLKRLSDERVVHPRGVGGPTLSTTTTSHVFVGVVVVAVDPRVASVNDETEMELKSNPH